MVGALLYALRVTRVSALREQVALALNRAADPAQAESVLLELLNERGSSGEAHAVLERLYKDQWAAACYGDQSTLALGLMDKAIEAYFDGFAVDTRNPYAGVNAATSMAIREPPDARLSELLPLVIYVARQRVESGTFDYWDYATLLDAAVLANDQETASRVLLKALAVCMEGGGSQNRRHEIVDSYTKHGNGARSVNASGHSRLNRRAMTGRSSSGNFDPSRCVDI